MYSNYIYNVLERQMNNMTNGALSGVRVIDLTRVIAGPHCTMILGDLGADVIKIEKSQGGDIGRGYGPYYKGESIYYMTHNRNKKSITLNFRHPKAHKILIDLIKDADVLVENYKAGTLEKMGLDPKDLLEINPGLVITRISGFGQEGPYSKRPCFDAVAQSISGLMDMNGEIDQPPEMIGAYVCDISAGLYGVIGTLAALYRKKVTGRGQVVDVSLLDSAMPLTHTAILNYFLCGDVITRNGNQDRAAWPSNFYFTKDHKMVYIHLGNDPEFKAFCKMSGQEELLKDPYWATLDGRGEHIEECDKMIADYAAQYDMATLCDMCDQNNIPNAPVNSVSEAVNNEQLIYRKMIREVEHPKFGKIMSPGPVVKMSETDTDVYNTAPDLGQDNDLIYGEYLGLSKSEIETLKKDGVI